MAVSGTAPVMGLRDWGWMLLLSGVWSGSFFFYKLLVGEIPPLTLVLGRVGLAAVVLNLWLWVSGEAMPGSRRLWRDFLIVGMMNNVIPFTLFAWGEMRITSGVAAILNAMTPVCTMLVAQVLTDDEKLSWNKVAGVGFSFLGVAVLIGPSALGGFGSGDVLGSGACLLAAVSYGFGGVLSRRFKGLSPMQTATGQISASAVILLPLSLVVEHPWALPMPSATAWGGLIGIALLSTVLAYLIYFRLLARVGATNASLVTFLLPISALMLGAALLDEAVTAQAFAGMALIGAGLAAIDGRLWPGLLALNPRRGRAP